MDNRFQDQNFRLSDFQEEVAVVCLQCGKKAVAKADYVEKKARLFCAHCGFNKEKETLINYLGKTEHFKTAANHYFDADLWYQSSFRIDVFWAYNEAHLLYLENYIGAKHRQSNNRTHFTLLEKLPKFYHEAKNRKALLKIIHRLKEK